jgi:hypothetical protein
MTPNEHPEALAGLSSTVARDAAAVDRAVNSIGQRIDTMVLAVRREDWSGVSRASRRLAQKARTEGYRSISALAERVCDEASEPHNVIGIKRSMIRLIGAQGRIPHRTAT